MTSPEGRPEGLPPQVRLRQMLLGPRPAFYALQPVKRDLVQRLGPEAAARWLMEPLGGETPWKAVWRPLEGLWSHARALGREVECLVPARPVHVHPVSTLGGDDLPAGDYRSRAVLRTILDDVVVHSKSNFLRCGDTVLLDVHDGELDRWTLDLDTDAAVIAVAPGRVALLERDGPPDFDLDQALSLVGLHSFAFGHWISELLPRLWACLDVPAFRGATLLVDAQMPAQHLEALRLFAGDGHPVQVLGPGQRARVRRFWAVASPLYYPIGARADSDTPAGWGAVDTTVYTDLLERIAPRWQPRVPPAGPPRLFLARADHQHRRMLNRTEVEPWFGARGYAIHDFNGLGFVQQLSLIRGARTIVGPEGSSFFCTFFGAPELRMGIMTGPTLDISESYAQITRALGQSLTVMLGQARAKDRPGQYFADYTVDMAALPRFVEAVEGRHGGHAVS